MQSIPGYSDLRAIRVEPWGTVYAATQTSVGRQVEIHAVGEHVDTTARHALVRAVRTAASLGLASVSFCIDLDPDGTFFVLERPGAVSLAQALGSMDAESRRPLAASLLRTWAAVHSAGLLCGSVRPDAVRVRADGSPCVVLCPYLHDSPVHAFETDALPWLPAWITRGEGHYDERAERAAVATLVCAVLTSESAHEAVAALGSSNVPAEAAELLVAIAAGASDAPLDTVASCLSSSPPHEPTARERHEADVLVASLYADADDADGTVADDHSRATFADELDLAALIDVTAQHDADDARPGAEDVEAYTAVDDGEGGEGVGADVESEPGLQNVGSIDFDASEPSAGDAVNFPALEVVPAQHLDPDAAARMLARLRRVEEWIHGPNA